MTRMRVGRMQRWQRRTTYTVLAACAATGSVWFVMLDFAHASPSRARFWWVAHGITAVLAAMTIGGAIVQHVVATWRSSRGRWSGSINLALLAALVGTALYLMYGAEAGHDAMHWIHSIVGLVAVLGFAWHVIWGRTRKPTVHRRRGTPGSAP